MTNAGFCRFSYWLLGVFPHVFREEKVKDKQEEKGGEEEKKTDPKPLGENDETQTDKGKDTIGKY